jgi:hypothetical protein
MYTRMNFFLFYFLLIPFIIHRQFFMAYPPPYEMKPYRVTITQSRLHVIIDIYYTK